MKSDILEIPCSYQGGKQRLAKQIIDIFYKENNINDDTKFFDLCCGSGQIIMTIAISKCVTTKKIIKNRNFKFDENE